MKPSRRNIYNEIIKCVNSNGGKLLNTYSSRGRYGWYERDRQKDQSYYSVRISGNRIVAHRHRYEMNGKGINTFIGITIPAILAGDTNLIVIPERKREVIVEMSIRRWPEFIAAYKAATPNLDWW